VSNKGNKEYDVVIIGAGIIGLFIAYYLSKTNVRTLVIEKEVEPGFGVSKGHAGVIHVIQLPFKSLRSRLALEGNRKYQKIVNELGVEFRRVNTILVAINPLHLILLPILYLYLKRGLRGRYNIKILFSRDKIRKYEPNISRRVYGGILIEGYGIIDSFDLVYSLYRYSSLNGVEFRFGYKVVDICSDDDFIVVYTDDGKKFYTRYLINAAGLYADEIANKIGDEIKYEYGKGVMIVFLEKISKNILAPIYLKPDPKTKGGAIIPTIDGKSIWGPNLKIVNDKRDNSVHEEDIKIIRKKFMKIIEIKPSKIIKAYAGVRPIPEGDDFIIRYSKKNNRIIHVAGIESPGLTAAPAIAETVLDMLRKAGLNYENKECLMYSKTIYSKRLILSEYKLGKGDYIISPYSKVSRDDVRKAVKDGVKTLQGLTFRLKLGFDEEQYTPFIWMGIKALAEELGVTPDKITLRGGKSWMVKRY